MTEKNVRIRLFKDNSRYKGDLFVSVNGVNYKIRRGVEVEGPPGGAGGAGVAAVLALTMWRSGTVTQILEGTRDLKTWMPSTSQTQPDQLPMLGQPVQDDQRTPTQPEQLGKPVQDK